MGHGMNRIISRLLHGVRFVCLGTAGGLIAAAALLVTYQNELILPSSISPDPGPPAPQGVEEEMLETEDHEHIRLWHLRDQKLGEHPIANGQAMIILHGNGETVATSLHTQKFFSSLGFSTYAIDYRGTGGSSGAPTEKGLFRDVEAAWKYVARSHAPATITLFGRSFGTGLASYLANKFEARTLILISPYLSIPKIVRDRGALSLLTPFLRYNIPAESFIETLHNACIIAAHGVRDTIIQVHHTQELRVGKDSKSRLEKIIIPEADHDSIMDLAQDRVLEAVQACFTNAT